MSPASQRLLPRQTRPAAAFRPKPPPSIGPAPVGVARQAKPPGSSGRLPFDDHWSYVVYAEEVLLRYFNDQTKVQIGTIPWITNNPGNEGINPNIRMDDQTEKEFREFPIPERCKETDPAKKKEKSVDPGGIQTFPIELGAVGLYACRYAIYSTLAEGLEKAEREKMEAERTAGLPVHDPRQKYVQDIRKFVLDAWLANARDEGETVAAPQLGAIRQRVNSIMSRKIRDIGDIASDPDIVPVLIGLAVNEGLLATPGVRYTCAGFADSLNPPEAYDKRQQSLMSKLKADPGATTHLRALLGCGS